MKRLILCVGLALTGCGGTNTAVNSAATVAAHVADIAGVPAAPLTKTVIDEKALTLASQTVDALALSASALVKVHAITPGSPTALSLANGLERTRTWINIAATARDAGNAASYADALAKASDALAQVRAALNGGN